MNVWIFKQSGLHYHITDKCEAVNFKPSGYPKEDYEQVRWIEAVNEGFEPCPLCHSNFDIKEVVRVVVPQGGE